MSAHPLRVAVIVASTREGRFGPTVAAWFAGEAAGRTDVDAEIIDLAGPGPGAGPGGDLKAGSDRDPAASLSRDREASSGRDPKAGSGRDPAASPGRDPKAGSGRDPAASPGRDLKAGPDPEARSVTARLAAADAFVIVTPEYNHSYPAPLKAVIDSHSREWHAKPVGFVSYGGLSGGLRAVEHLRPVFAELHAVTVRDTVSFHGGRSCFGPDGRPLDPREPGAAAHRLLDRLTWWGVTLRDAHRARPYVTA